MSKRIFLPKSLKTGAKPLRIFVNLLSMGCLSASKKSPGSENECANTRAADTFPIFPIKTGRSSKAVEAIQSIRYERYDRGKKLF